MKFRGLVDVGNMGKVALLLNELDLEVEGVSEGETLRQRWEFHP